MKKALSQPTAKAFAVVDLVAAAREGRLRVPEFQRPLRWQWEDVRRLFDSILRGYPIGNLLLWVRPAPAGPIRLGALHIDSPAFQEGLWVVDGQQRLTSLANALSDEGATNDRFGLAYDLGSGEFVSPDPRREDGGLIPLPVLFELPRLIRWFTKEHPEAADWLDEAAQVTRAIREYQVPASLVSQEDEATLRDIFDRMNNYGKRLSRAEVFSALHPGVGDSAGPRSHFQQIAEVVHRERGFGLLDDDTVLRAVLARRGGNVSREIRIEFANERSREPRDFEGELPEAAYREGEAALLRAVAFLQEEAGIPHFAFLPYRYLLVVLARYFAHFPDPHSRNLILLRRWFWRAAMMGPGPFASSWTNAMRILATRIVAGEESDSIQRLLQPPIDNGLRVPQLVGFKTNSAAGRILSSALWELRPRSWIDGQPYERSRLADAVPPEGTLRGILRPMFTREPEPSKGSAANRLFVLEEELPGSLRDLLLEPLLERGGNTAEFLASHALDDEALAALARGDKAAFLTHREARMERIARAFLERSAETEFEDTPPLDDLDLDDPDEVRDDQAA